MEQNTIQLDSSEQERIVFNAFFQHPNPPKAEVTGSNPVGRHKISALARLAGLALEKT